ncbi:hypothetical protein [Dokdonella soli]|uniref:hypothetical protein n=1 Tax=Dokdonella soli TaxID=529810 RepID=UPI0031D652E3
MPNAKARGRVGHRQQPATERREFRPQAATDAEAGIAHAAECDQCAEQQHERAERTQRAAHELRWVPTWRQAG